MPLRPGLVARQEFESVRHGPVALFAAFAVGTGEVFAQGSQRPPNREFRHFLRALRARDPESRWPLRGDTAGEHKKQAVLDGCAAHRPKVSSSLVAYPGLVAQSSGDLVLDLEPQVLAPGQCPLHPGLAEPPSSLQHHLEYLLCSSLRVDVYRHATGGRASALRVARRLTC